MNIEKHLRTIAPKGGKATVLKYGIEQMKIWGKLGGRPKSKSKKKRMSHSGSFPKGK